MEPLSERTTLGIIGLSGSIIRFFFLHTLEGRKYSANMRNALLILTGLTDKLELLMNNMTRVGKGEEACAGTPVEEEGEEVSRSN